MENIRHILVLEDNSDTFENIIAKKLQSSHYKIIPECTENRTEHSKFTDSINRKFDNTICDYVNEKITNNYQTLRAIVCDLQMGDCDKGAEIIRDIRTKIKIDKFPEYTQFIPIIIYTNFGNDPLIKTALANNPTAYIDKHMDKDASCLKTVVDYHCEQFSKLCNKFILKKKYNIGLTFTGTNFDKNIPHRAFIEEIANKLAHKYSYQKVFYDKFHEAEFKQLKASQKLEQVYREECEYIAVFLSKDYATTNEWTGIEWSAVQKYAKDNPDKIIPIKIENYNTETTPDLGKDDIYHDAVSELTAFNELKLKDIKSLVSG